MSRKGGVSLTVLLVMVAPVLVVGNNYCHLSCPSQQGEYLNTICVRENLRCGAGVTCGPDFKEIFLSDDDRQYILDIHNYLRNRVAMGTELRGGQQPSAANMNTLRYNKELEFMAQCWINECHADVIAHDKCRRTDQFSWVGQNLAFIGSTSSAELTNKIAIIKKLILGWYDEVELYNNTWVYEYQPRSVKVGHYTALVWADTKEVGCAMSYYSYVEGNLLWYVLKLACNYGPGGNYLGQPLYKIGKPATKCAGRKSNKRYPGLCGVDIHLNQTRHYENSLFKYHV